MAAPLTGHDLSGGDHGDVSLVMVSLGDPRARALEAAHIAEMNNRYGSGGPGRVAPEGFDPPDGCFLLAVVDGTPVGCGGFRPLGPGRAELKRMYVDPSQRGRGVGRRLLRELEARADRSPVDGQVSAGRG